MSIDEDTTTPSGIRYRVVDSTADLPSDHTKVGDDEYVAPTADGVDMLEEQGVIEVLDWDHSAADTTNVTFDGAAEPVVRDDGSVSVLTPTDDGGNVESKGLGEWECQRCGAITEIPPSTSDIANNTLPEPHECEGCERQGPFKHAGGLSEHEVQAVLRAGDIWHPPSTVSDEGYAELWADVRQFIYAHWDAKEDWIYEGLTAYTLSTWVRENLTFVPHLMLMGKTTGGKTRLLNTLARVSYRALVSASATPASMFRLIDSYNVSYYISEYHGLDPDARRELDNVIRAGQKRGEIVTRAEPTSTGHEPRVYDPFSHVAVATQYEPDDDIVNRCIQVRSSAANRDMPATFDEETARSIRNRLLYARFRLLESDEWEQAEREAYGYLEKQGIDGRTREKLLSLVTVAIVWGRLDALQPFVEETVTQDREAAADSEDADVVRAIRDAAHHHVSNVTVIGDDPYSAVKIPYSDEETGGGVVERYETMTGTERTSSWVGHVVKRLGLEKERTRDGTVISDPDLRPKLQELCEELNIAWDPDADDPTDSDDGANDGVTQSDAVRRVRDTLDRLVDERDGRHVPRETLIEELDGELDGRDPEHLIEKALKQGRFYESQEGYLAPT